MAENKGKQNEKRYYWLKLKNTYFSQLEQKKMKRQPNGRDMQIIYLRMMLLSIDKGGFIYYQGIFDSLEEELAEEFDESLELISSTLEYLKKNRMISLDEERNCFIPGTKECIGSESYSAERMRNKRKRDKASQCDKGVTASDEEIEIELELEKREKKKHIVEQSPTARPYKEIIEYLNQRTGKKYKHTSKATQRHINARIAEGFSLEDFKRVIDWKVNDWMGTEMEKFLRPETLFGTKFEGYLNAAPAAVLSLSREPPEPEESIDYSQVKREW